MKIDNGGATTLLMSVRGPYLYVFVSRTKRAAALTFADAVIKAYKPEALAFLEPLAAGQPAKLKPDHLKLDFVTDPPAFILTYAMTDRAWRRFPLVHNDIRTEALRLILQLDPISSSNSATG